MKKSILMIKFCFTTLLFVGLLAGCANKVPTYAVSTNNLMMIKSLSKNNKAVSLGKFTDSNRNESKVMCRLTLPIGTPNGENFASYIQDAFQKELLIGNMYDKTSSRKVTMNLDNIYGSTILGNAYWEFKITMNSSNGKSFKVQSKYDYESSYFASSACSEMQRSFVPAVQKLLGDVVRNNEFKNLLN